jgi:hypothetical protein
LPWLSIDVQPRSIYNADVHRISAKLLGGKGMFGFGEYDAIKELF